MADLGERKGNKHYYVHWFSIILYISLICTALNVEVMLFAVGIFGSTGARSGIGNGIGGRISGGVGDTVGITGSVGVDSNVGGAGSAGGAGCGGGGGSGIGVSIRGQVFIALPIIFPRIRGWCSS